MSEGTLCHVAYFLKSKIYFLTVDRIFSHIYCFVCVEVLRPSQPNRVMSSAVKVYLTTHLLGRLKRLTSILHILSLETDNCPSCISGISHT